jgi:hypothetical protein
MSILYDYRYFRALANGETPPVKERMNTKYLFIKQKLISFSNQVLKCR